MGWWEALLFERSQVGETKFSVQACSTGRSGPSMSPLLESEAALIFVRWRRLHLRVSLLLELQHLQLCSSSPRVFGLHARLWNASCQLGSARLRPGAQETGGPQRQNALSFLQARSLHCQGGKTWFWPILPMRASGILFVFAMRAAFFHCWKGIRGTFQCDKSSTAVLLTFLSHSFVESRPQK